MASAPKPITSPPPLPWQPYDATADGSGGDQTAATTIYDPAGGNDGGGPWVKIKCAGAADGSGASTEAWPGNGASGNGGWTQT